ERTIIERTSAESLASEAEWGLWARHERFMDRRDTDDASELNAAGDEVLLIEGVAQTAMRTVPSEGRTMAFPTAWNLGDRITVISDNAERTEIVTSVEWLVDSGGARVGMGIGDTDSLSRTSRVDA